MSETNNGAVDYKARMQAISKGKKLSVAERAQRYYDLYGEYICKRCFTKPAVYKNRLCAECRQKEVEEYTRTKAKFSKNKEKVLDYYGRKCNCCGESMIEVLEVDHINTDGAEHRKSLKKSSGKGGYICTHLVETNFKDAARFQLLCANCNKAKAYHGRKRQGYHGTCPHEEFREDFNVMKELLQEQGLTPMQLDKEIKAWVEQEGWADIYQLLRKRDKL